MKKQNKQKGKSPLTTGGFKLDTNQVFLWSNPGKVQITHIPTLSKCVKELFINVKTYRSQRRVVQKSWEKSHQNKHADRYLQRNIPKQV